MDFNVSVGDDNRDTRILAPWFLNCLNKVTNSNTSKFELKHGIFGRTAMNAFKGNKEKYEKYVNLKGGTPEYEKIVNMVVDYLESDGLIQKLPSNPAKIAITQKGIDLCDEEGSWNKRYHPIEEGDDIAKDPGYLKYR